MPLRTTITIVILAASLLCIGGCHSDSFICGPRTLPPRPARINHLAFFKLQNPQDAAELIADCDAHLATIPGVVSYYCGTHLDTGRGAPVDGDYDVGFYVGFMTEADLATYQKHSAHLAMIEKWKPRWQWIRVHDVLDDTP